MAKVLKYNPDLGAIVDTKVVSVSEEPSEDATGTGSKKSPHDRRETTWRPYVLNPRDGEEILDVKEIRGKTRYQVERPRKGSGSWWCLVYQGGYQGCKPESSVKGGAIWSLPLCFLLNNLIK